VLVSIVDFISSEVDRDGGDSCRHKMRKAVVLGKQINKSRYYINVCLKASS